MRLTIPEGCVLAKLLWATIPDTECPKGEPINATIGGVSGVWSVCAWRREGGEVTFTLRGPAGGVVPRGLGARDLRNPASGAGRSRIRGSYGEDHGGNAAYRTACLSED